MKHFYKAILSLTFLVILCETAFPISAGIQSSKDYYFTMSVLRQIKPMIENFKTDDLYNDYKKLLTQFEQAALDFYGKKFDDSVTKFYDLKLEMMNFLEKLSDVYLKRTEILLSASIKDNNAINIFIEYDKHSGYAEYFKKPFDPLRDVKPYNSEFTAQDYHFFYDSFKIEDWLNSGYYYHEHAKSIFEGKEIKFIKSEITKKKKKNNKTDSINYIIEKYLDIISMCRTSKQCALEIYKCKNESSTGDILKKYNISKSQMTPIFDDRIPEDYKVDAVDNIKLLYSVELERKKKVLGQ